MPSPPLTWEDTTRAERREMRKLGLPLPRRIMRRYHKKKADAIYQLEMREAVMRMRIQHGWSYEQIARRLGQNPNTIRKYRKKALALSAQRANGKSPHEERAEEKKRLGFVRGYAFRPMRIGNEPTGFQQKKLAAENPNPTPNPPRPGGHIPKIDPDETHPLEGEVLDPPEIVQLRKDCLKLRKAMIPFDQIAELLGVTEREARKAAAEALSQIEASESLNADLERRLMIEQIDQMIQAIHPMSTGRLLNDERTPVVLEAIDRMLRLMDRKANLMGIAHPPAVDIRIRLQQLAAEGGYDIVDLEDMARDVLQAHKIRLPEMR